MDSSNRLFSVLLLLLVLISAANSLGGASKKRPLWVGNYQLITNLNDPEVVAVARFAVKEHNRKGADDLEFLKVLCGQEQIVAGTNYKLIIYATHRGRRGLDDMYKALVFDGLRGNRNLTSFELL